MCREYLGIRWNIIKKFIQIAEPIYRTLIQKREAVLQTGEER